MSDPFKDLPLPVRRAKRVAKKGVPGSEVPWPPPVGSTLRYIVEGGFGSEIYEVRAQVDWVMVLCFKDREDRWTHILRSDFWYESGCDRSQIWVELPETNCAAEETVEEEAARLTDCGEDNV